MIIVSFFFNDTATTEIYTLSLHDALPISLRLNRLTCLCRPSTPSTQPRRAFPGVNVRGRLDSIDWAILKELDRKSTRLNSSHANISYAVFCLKKKKMHGSSFYTSQTLIIR